MLLDSFRSTVLSECVYASYETFVISLRLSTTPQTRLGGRMSRAFISRFGRLWNSNSWVRTLVESNQWLKKLYLSLPSQALGIIRRGQWLIGSVSEYCDWVGYQAIVIGLSVRHHYKAVMNVHCHKLVGVAEWLERPPPALGDRGIWRSWVRIQT